MNTEPTIRQNLSSSEGSEHGSGAVSKPLQVDLTSLTLYIDGSDGSLWQARECWNLILSEWHESTASDLHNESASTTTPLANTRFVRLSDLMQLLTQNNISFK